MAAASKHHGVSLPRRIVSLRVRVRASLKVAGHLRDGSIAFCVVVNVAVHLPDGRAGVC